jgi:hypothetical protein
MAAADDATVNGGKFITFAGNNAVSATLVPTSNTDASAHLIAFLNNNRLYMILGGNLSQANFNTYSGTFKLTK